MTTKDQERDALKKIRKIVETLGEDSYIVTAFDGCFEIAEENIENDFACSMKQRWEAAEKEAEHFRELAGRLTDELESTKKRLIEEEKKALSLSDLGTLKALLIVQETEAQKTVERSAEEIINFADDPSSENFKEAVKHHRAALRKIDKNSELIQRILKAMK